MNRRDVLVTGGALAALAYGSARPKPAFAQPVQGESWRARKRRVSVRGLQMAWYEAGSGDPIVFLHGNPTSSYLWRNVIPHVEHLGRCIAPDMVGMGDSDPLPDPGPGRYSFATHRDYLFETFDQIGVADNAIFVVHDWGSGVGFSWAQRHPDRVRGLAFMEPILRPPEFAQTPAPTAGAFATFRSDAGLQAVLEENMFVEQLLIGGLEYYLTEEDKAEYRRPFAEPGPSRWPTLEWPRQLPMGGEPRDTEELVMGYTRWLREDPAVPKLFVRALPGAILGNPQLLEYVRGFSHQREVSVYGGHYVQEVSPHAIGRALSEWIVSLR
jgi:haloalkane dehalogenase